MPFGMGKKEKEAEDKASRSSLFSRSKGKDKAAAPSANPYAAQATPDPYGTKPASSAAPPAYDNRTAPSGMSDKSPVPPGGYGGSTPRFGGSGNYAQQSGYGSNPYGSEQPQASRYGAGGYGGHVGSPGGYGQPYGGQPQPQPHYGRPQSQYHQPPPQQQHHYQPSASHAYPPQGAYQHGYGY